LRRQTVCLCGGKTKAVRALCKRCHAYVLFKVKRTRTAKQGSR
jgi:hypothetical protein